MLGIWNVCVDREANRNEALSAVGFRGLEKGKKKKRGFNELRLVKL